MKKTLFLFAAVALLLPSAAFAAPTGWKPAAECVVPPDHGIWNVTNTAITGCITSSAWDAAQAAQAANFGDQSKLVAFFFPSGTVRTGSNGVSYTCPWWFGFISCILPEVAR